MPYIFACSASDVLRQLHNLPFAVPPANNTAESGQKLLENDPSKSGESSDKIKVENNLKKASKYVSSLKGRVVVKNGPKLCYKRPGPSPPNLTTDNRLKNELINMEKIEMKNNISNYNNLGVENSQIQNINSNSGLSSGSQQIGLITEDNNAFMNLENNSLPQNQNEVEKEVEEEEEEAVGFVCLHRPENVFEPRITENKTTDMSDPEFDFSVNYENPILAKISISDDFDGFESNFRANDLTIPRTISMSAFSYNYNALPNFSEDPSFTNNHNNINITDNNDNNSDVTGNIYSSDNTIENELNSAIKNTQIKVQNIDLNYTNREDCNLNYMKNNDNEITDNQNQNKMSDNEMDDKTIKFKKSRSMNEINLFEKISKKDGKSKNSSFNSQLSGIGPEITVKALNSLDESIFSKSHSSFDLINLEELKKKGAFNNSLILSSSCSNIDTFVGTSFFPSYEHSKNSGNSTDKNTILLHAPRPSYAYELSAARTSKPQYKISDSVSPPPVNPPHSSTR
jgi:hypothetical protein